MCSVCVIEKFYAWVDPLRGDLVHIFTQTFPSACRVCVSISVANGQKTWPPNANTHTPTDNLSYIRSLYCEFGVHGVRTALATSYNIIIII